MKILGRETHPDADRFPMLEGFTRKAFIADVKKNGFRDARIYIDKKGRILDGRNRAQAAEQLGLEAQLEWITYEGQDTESFVKTCNLHRRNMNGSVRALVAGSFATRQRGRVSQNRPRADLTAAQLAEEYDVSEREIERGRVVHEKGVQELHDAVRDELVTIGRAAEIALLEPEAQRHELAKDKPEARDQLGRKRAQNNNEKRPPAEYLLSHVVRSFEKLGATIETLEAGLLLVRFDDQTFELQLRPSERAGRAA